MRTVSKTILATALITASAASLAQQDSSRSTLRWLTPANAGSAVTLPPAPSPASVENMNDWFARNAGKSLTVAVVDMCCGNPGQPAAPSTALYSYGGTLNEILTVFTVSVSTTSVNVYSQAYWNFGTAPLQNVNPYYAPKSYSFNRSDLDSSFSTYSGFLVRDQSTSNLAWRMIGIPALAGGITAVTNQPYNTPIDQLSFTNTAVCQYLSCNPVMFSTIASLGIPADRIIITRTAPPAGGISDPGGSD
jgi:hypothetical protein